MTSPVTPSSPVGEIPEDVRALADSVWLDLSNISEPMNGHREAETDVIARAILAEREAATARERERCANVAENYGAMRAEINTRDVDVMMQNAAAEDAASAIAASIRGTP